MKIARYRAAGPQGYAGAGGTGRAESHVSAVIGKATPTTEARRIAKIEKPTPTPLKHGGNGVSGGTRNPAADWGGRKVEGAVETHSLKEIKRESVIPV